MGAEVIANLVVMYGLPFTERMIELWEKKAKVDMAEWRNLLSLVKTPEDALAIVATAAGIALDDARVVELANLIKANA